MFSVAAKALANAVSEADLEQGRIYPSLTKIKEVSAAIATAVAEVAYSQGLARKPKPVDISAYIKSQMYEPNYMRYV
jgi:malate dehydrogenase (oxaloacetate-decarboxylating)(NADP+)